MEDIKCDLQVAVSWAVIANTSLKNVHSFSANKLVFGKNQNFPNICDDLLPALENKTKEIVAKNLNVLHLTMQNYINSLKASSWAGPAMVIGQDGQQKLIKYHSRYTRVHFLLI